MDRNLGASQVATSSDDAASYGDLYQWGRGTDGHQIRTSATTTTLSSADVPGHGNFILSYNDQQIHLIKTETAHNYNITQTQNIKVVNFEH